jgi:UDP-N-acetylglucosamine 4,6-dehydratase/5-epimerase
VYANKKILIIGGTGTIGRYLLKRIIKEDPAVIRIFSREEFKQFELQQEMKQFSNIRYLIGDVRDYSRLLRAMEDIDYVFHLAAMKHVPFCEYNPFEAVQTNVIGTQNVIQAAIHAGVKKVLFTSTDKAISPTNTYGATKLTAERLISAAEYQKGPRSTVFSSVRFGNVMGSRGSVIPLFKKQIIEKHLITVTDMNMLRFMMTPSQATSLLLKANELARGGEVFVLKMPVVKLSHLVDVMIEEVVKKYHIQELIQIEEIGLRPGEKMFEELMTEDEMRLAYETAGMYIIPSNYSDYKWPYQKIGNMEKFSPSCQSDSVISKETLRQWILKEGLI